MAVGETVSSNVEALEIHERRPLMSGGNILMMNLGFFGVQFSFGLTQSAVNPLFTLIGATPDELPILNIAGPITGLIIQPLIGAISDKTWSDRWGRRKPFILGGAFLCAIVLFLFPFVSVLWVGVLCLWLLDAGNNTSTEPYRALLSERLPESQVARGFLTQSMFTGAGAVLANLSLFILQKVIVGNAGNGVPYWIWRVLPRVFPELLPNRPGDGYARFGFVYEPGRDRPIGTSVRAHPVELVGLNCAVCHSDNAVRSMPNRMIPRVSILPSILPTIIIATIVPTPRGASSSPVVITG